MMQENHVPEGFRMTEIGYLPEQWSTAKLGEIVEIFDKLRIPVREEDRNRQLKKYPYCGANGIIDLVEDFIFEGEHLLLAEDGGHWNKFEQSSYIMSGKFWVNNHAHVLRARDDLTTNSFLMYALNYQDLSAYVGGDVRGKINQGILRIIRVPFPSFSEQKQIAFVLSTVQQAIEKTQSIIKATKKLKESLMKHLFAYGPVSVNEAEKVVLKETEIGLIPEEWEVVKLGEIAECLDHRRIPLSSKERSKRKGRIPYYGASGIIDYVNDCLFDEPLLLVSEDGANLESRKSPIAYLTDGKCWVNNHIHVLRIKGAKRHFLQLYINSNSIRDYLTGTTRPKLNKSMLMQIRFPLPALSIQQEIVNKLSSVDRKIEIEEIRKEALEELFRTLLNNLMTGKIRVTHLEVPHDQTW